MSEAGGQDPRRADGQRDRLSALARGRAGALAREVALFLAAYLAYALARGLARGGSARALADADALARAERALHLLFEPAVQAALLPHAGVLWVLDHVYLVAQDGVAPAVLVWLFLRAPRAYRRLRDTLLATWLLSLPVTALVPTAPPRLAGLGLVDTVSTRTSVSLDASGSRLLFNPYAALPSLHVAFALAVGLAVALVARRWWIRALGLAWPALVALATVATGNHFVLDAVAGAGLAAAGFAAARARAAAPRPRGSVRPTTGTTKAEVG